MTTDNDRERDVVHAHWKIPTKERCGYMSPEEEDAAILKSVERLASATDDAFLRGGGIEDTLRDGPNELGKVE